MTSVLAQLAEETPEVIEDYVRREGGLRHVARAAEAAKLDVLILGDDQNELFSNAMIPTFAIFVGTEAEVKFCIGFIGEKPEEKWLKIRDPKPRRSPSTA